MLREPADLIAALEDTWTSTVELCRELSDDEWQRTTGCPGWTVQDQLSHIVGLDTEMPSFMRMTATLRKFLPIRVVDCYAHEQDIRRATGRVGHLAGLAAEHTRDVIIRGWRRSADADGPAVRVVVTGSAGITANVPEGGAPVATITVDSSNFIALGCDRAGITP